MEKTRVLGRVVLGLALVAMLGCQSDDGVTDPAQSELGNASLVRGQIDGPADFEFLSEPATDDPSCPDAYETAWAQHVPTRIIDNPDDELFLGYYASDSILSMVVGGNYVPDVHVGRLPVRSEAELAGVLAVQGGALALAVGTVRSTDIGSLIPGDANPAQGVEDHGLGLFRAAQPVGVFDPQHKATAGVASVEPVEKGCARAADV